MKFKIKDEKDKNVFISLKKNDSYENEIDLSDNQGCALVRFEENKVIVFEENIKQHGAELELR